MKAARGEGREEVWGGGWAGAVLTFGFALALSRLRRALPARPWRPTGRIAVVGTFFNTNWFVSHAAPLARSGLKEVLVVTDEPSLSLDRIRFACPPAWLIRVVGRPLAKLAWLVRVGITQRPDLYMGYHIVPNSVSALVAGRLLGRPAAYQMTGGPIEVQGGGIYSENSWLIQLARPSRVLEKLALKVSAEFDLVVVRGTGARRFLQEAGVRSPVVIVPGSVDPERVRASRPRVYDLLYLGRFTETKRPLDFVDIVAGLQQGMSRLRAVMVGEGPLLQEARQRAERLGVATAVEFAGQAADVSDYVETSRVFVLTSRSEGLSIAMAEAMMAGAVPVVARVGDLGDLVRDGENGYLVAPGDCESFVARIRCLLEDHRTWERLSGAAVASARAHVAVEHVASLWKKHLGETVRRASAPPA